MGVGILVSIFFGGVLGGLGLIRGGDGKMMRLLVIVVVMVMVEEEVELEEMVKIRVRGR